MASSCADKQPIQPVYCPAPIHPSPEARAWLKQLSPPETVNEYLSKIGEQQKVFDRGCK